MVEMGWIVIWAAFSVGVVLGVILAAMFSASKDFKTSVPDESLPPHRKQGPS